MKKKRVDAATCSRLFSHSEKKDALIKKKKKERAFTTAQKEEDFYLYFKSLKRSLSFWCCEVNNLLIVAFEIEKRQTEKKIQEFQSTSYY